MQVLIIDDKSNGIIY
jgi:glutathione S-transferase